MRETTTDRSDNSPKESRKLVQRLSLVVSLLGFFLYANTLNHGYVLDDLALITKNSSTQQGFFGIAQIFKTPYRHGYAMSHDELYRPLSKSLLAIEWSAMPGDPRCGHWVNVLLFCVTGFVLMSVLHQYTRSINLSFVVSLLFIAHPIHTEVVANIKSNDEILSFLFAILALRSSRHYFESSRLRYLLLSTAFVLLAVFSKESMVIFPLIFLLTWYFFWDGTLEADGEVRRDVPKLLLSLVGYASVILFFLTVRYSVVEATSSAKVLVIENSLVASPDLSHRLATAIHVLGIYLKLLLFPHPLVYTYSYSQIPIVAMNDMRFVVPFAVLTSLVLAALLDIRKKPIWAYGVWFFILSSSIISNIFIIIGTELGERLMYLPSLGFCIVLGYILDRYLGASSSSGTVKQMFIDNWKLYVFGFLILSFYAVKTMERNLAWKSNLALFVNDIDFASKSARAHYCLGNILLEQVLMNTVNEHDKDGLMNAAIEELKRSISIYPAFTEARSDLGIAYMHFKKYEDAIELYEESTTYFPNEPIVYSNLGFALNAVGNFAGSELAFKKAISLKPDYLDAYVNLIRLLKSQNKPNDAKAILEEALLKFPESSNLQTIKEEW